MGPVHTLAGIERARAIVADAEKRGATVRRLGVIHNEDTFDAGYFMQPTVVTDIDDDSRLMQEEQFCPVIPVVRYSYIEDAISRANATVFGLGGSVWGKDIDKALVAASRLQAGTVFINTHGTNSVNRKAPYGGLKQSGSGRRAGLEGLMEYMQSQTLTTYER